MPDVTIVTYAGTPAGAPDDLALARALRDRGAGARVAVWGDPDVDWSATPVTVVRSTWDYHLDPPAWSAWIDRVEGVTRLVNPPGLLRWNGEKTYLLDLAAAGVPVIPTALVADAGALAGLCVERGWGDVVVKPAVGAGSLGARRFRETAIAGEGTAHARALLADGQVLVQPYQATVETERERALVFVAGGFTHAFSKPGFHSGVAESALLSHQPTGEEYAVAARVFAALPEPPVAARIDLLPSADGPLLMEAELIEPQLGFHIAPAAADALAAALLDLP